MRRVGPYSISGGRLYSCGGKPLGGGSPSPLEPYLAVDLLITKRFGGSDPHTVQNISIDRHLISRFPAFSRDIEVQVLSVFSFLMFLLKTKDGLYVAASGKAAYTKDPKKARQYPSHQAAARHRAVTESIVSLDETTRA